MIHISEAVRYAIAALEELAGEPRIRAALAPVWREALEAYKRLQGDRAIALWFSHLEAVSRSHARQFLQAGLYLGAANDAARSAELAADYLGALDGAELPPGESCPLCLSTGAVWHPASPGAPGTLRLHPCPLCPDRRPGPGTYHPLRSEPPTRPG